MSSENPGKAPWEIKRIQDAVEFAMHCREPRNWDPSKEVMELFNHPVGIWFRGHANGAWRLEPSVFRKHKDYDESSMFYEFRLSTQNEPQPATFVEWLTTMQHHSLPTRTLDWTTSVLVALYFAVVTDPFTTGDETHTKESDFQTKQQEKKLDEPEEPPEHEECCPEQEKWSSPKLICLNARRLNRITTVRQLGPWSAEVQRGIASPTLLDSTLRALQAGSGDKYQVLTSKEVSTSRDLFQPFVSEWCREWAEALRKPIAKFCPDTDDGSDLHTRFWQLLSTPIATYPARRVPRIIAQHGMLTVHGGKTLIQQDVPEALRLPRPRSLRALDRLHKRKEGKNKGILKEAVVQDPEQILKELQAIQVHRGTLFLDLDQQSRRLREVWRKKPKASKS